jgi:tetratricopeptide (TPR) repeat protein
LARRSKNPLRLDSSPLNPLPAPEQGPMNPLSTTLRLAIAAVLTVAVLARNATGQTPEPPAFDSRISLAVEIGRSAMSRAAADPLTVESLETAVRLMNEALKLDPDNPYLWRMQLQLAAVAERDDLLREAVERISKLDPGDDVIRLMRLNAALDQCNTLEQRVAAMGRLLTDENISRVGPAVASRLQLDLALLHRRNGDNDAFAAALSRAMALDPSNRSAAALAAGYFRLQINDPLAEAELLVNLMLADLTDISTQVALAQHLLENGAYAGAVRMYRMAVATGNANRFTPTSELLMDLSVALWANGEDDKALEQIRIRQHYADVVFRDLVRQKNKQATGLQLMELFAPIEPTTGTVRAAILASRKDPAAKAALQEVIDSNIQFMLNLQTVGQALDPAKVVETNLNMALLTVWLGDDLGQVEQFLADAEKIEPISPTARARFDGWITYRRGELDRAIELLTPIASEDPPARCGLALAMLAKGQKREAAIELLAVARQQPGTIIGVWAARELYALLGRRASVTPHAAQLEQLIASINRTIDRYSEDSTLALNLRVTPERDVVGPYEPVVVFIELTNNSMLPLALDKAGPIRPQLLFTVNINAAFMPELNKLPPLVIDIGRRLCLMPHERLVIPVDLRRLMPGRAFNALAVNGAIIRLEVMSNFIGTEYSTVEEGMLGLEFTAPLIRLEGVRADIDWLTQTVAAIQSESFGSQPGDTQLFAELCMKLASRYTQEMIAKEGDLLKQAFEHLPAAFKRLDPIGQAWVLSVTPAIDGLNPVFAVASESPERIVRMAYLMFKAKGPTDPVIAQVKAGDDKDLIRLVELLEIHIRQTEDMRADEAARTGGAASIRDPNAPAAQPTDPNAPLLKP